MSENFIGARRTRKMVSRDVELNQIKSRIFDYPGTCQIVLVVGPGGMGKTRLANEVLWRGGNRKIQKERGECPPDLAWQKDASKPVVFADLIDLIDVGLHARLSLMLAIRNALVGYEHIDFQHFEIAYAHYNNVRNQQADFDIIQQAVKEAEEAFLKDYSENERSARIVLVLDTAEKLYTRSSEKLLEKGLITTDDLTFNTGAWIARRISEGKIHNTTLLLVGRDVEGRKFFDSIQKAAHDATRHCKLSSVTLKSFTLEDTKTYLEYQLEDLCNSQAVKPSVRLESAIASLTEVLRNDDLLRVLWLYTGGQPVRMALYVDLLIEGHSIPDVLLESWEDAVDRVKTSHPIAPPPPELVQVQEAIEGAFLSILFHKPCLRTEILKILVRAQRGVDVDQLVYLLYAPASANSKTWKPGLSAIEEVSAELIALEDLAIVKKRPDGRLCLQDEVYHIYARYMRSLPEIQADERDERKALYEKLCAWAKAKRSENDQILRDLQITDERDLRIDTPGRALNVYFKTLTQKERDERSRVHSQIRFWQLERLYYSLLSDLIRNFNDAYFDLSDQWWRANDEESDAMAQQILQQVLWDEDSIAFMDLERWPSLVARDGQVMDAMRGLADQIDAVRWMRSFVLRKNYEAAIAFYEQLEKNIARWPVKDKKSWNHTFAWSERRCWYLYARILSSQDVIDALNELVKLAQNLEEYLTTDQYDYVNKRKKETGFRGHPAETRLKRVIAVMYHYAGYGYANQGYSGKALENYSQALHHLRGSHFQSQQATTRNNLSRVLSDMGKGYARLVCQDGLQLRRELAAEVAIAYSLNTLAVIDNDFSNLGLAWVEAAKAVAYFRRAEDARGLALALIELGQALRRLAGIERTGWTLTEPPEIIYNEAESAMREALKLFDSITEPLRKVEIELELGCLHRDRIRLEDNDELMIERYYRDAMDSLNKASAGAEKIKNLRLRLDAHVNMAWTHYFYAEHKPELSSLDDAENEIRFILADLIPEDATITQHKLPVPDRDDIFVFQQLSRLFLLRARIGMDRFGRRRQELITEQPTLDRDDRHEAVHNDGIAKGHLEQAARCYTLAYTYAMLFSPHSSVVETVQEVLYAYLKKFNQVELSDFNEYRQHTYKTYKLSDLKYKNIGDMSEFMSECFPTAGLNGDEDEE